MTDELGRKYVVVDGEGRALAFYAAGFNPTIPADAVPISDEVWAEWSQASQRKVWRDGDLVDAPAPASGPPPVPTSITARQARLALLQADLLDKVEAVVAAADRSAQIEWQHAATIERGSPLVATLAAKVPLTAAKLNDLFKAGAAL
jgi:hypothetical protein